MSVAEQKSMIHPSRSSSLSTGRSTPDAPYAQPTASGQVVFENGQYQDRPAPGHANAINTTKNGLQELAGMRAQLLAIQRRLLEHTGNTLGWTIGWAAILPSLNESEQMTEVSLDEQEDEDPTETTAKPKDVELSKPTLGIFAGVLINAVSSLEQFRQFYEVIQIVY